MVFGMQIYYDIYAEVRSTEDSTCDFYYRIDNVDVSFSEGFSENLRNAGATEEIIASSLAQAEEATKEVEGRDATCVFWLCFGTDGCAEPVERWKFRI